MSYKVTVVDYGMGNLRSIFKKFERLNIPIKISNEPDVIASSQKLILPGVGHFANGMKNLNDLKLLDVLNEKVLVQKCPILGICLGMQLFANSSEEGFVPGLKWLDSRVVKFSISDQLKYKVPHMGWNSIDKRKESKLLHGLTEDDHFYFVHSYHIMCNDTNDILSETIYDYQFISSVENENIYGTQFHPEKSFDAGDIIFQNFYNL